MYIDGKNPIRSNLLHLNGTQMKYHSYVSPIEVINLMFAFYILFEHIYLKDKNAENHTKDFFFLELWEFKN